MPKRDEFFRKLDILAVTFDDLGLNGWREFPVTVKTDYSDILPYQVSLETKFTRNVGLKSPIVSAAMDTVTGVELAIGLPIFGGIAILPRNKSAEEQARDAGRVKHHFHGGLIEKPIAVRPDESVEEVLNRREEKGYTFHSFPVLDEERRLVGFITQNNFKFARNVQSRIRDIMTQSVLTGSANTTIDEAFEIMQRQEKGALPLIDGDGRLVGLYVYSDLKRLKNGPTSYNLDSRGQLRVAAAIGVGEKELYRAELLDKKNIDALVLNSAHADSSGMIGMLRELKSGRIRADIAVGNISEAHSAKRLCEAGSDGNLCNQGPGSICTTRVVAGVGCPAATAIHNVSSVGDSYGVPTGGDGGIVHPGHATKEDCIDDPVEEAIKHPGDITKALGAGAHYVVVGSVLAGTKEAPGEIFWADGQRWKTIRGMGSLDAMVENEGSRGRYGQRDVKPEELIPEGVVGRVPYKGPLGPVVYQYLGGLRSGMGYVGAHTIDELREKADFWLITPAGRREAHPRNIVITKDAPNYARDDNK